MAKVEETVYILDCMPPTINKQAIVTPEQARNVLGDSAEKISTSSAGLDAAL